MAANFPFLPITSARGEAFLMPLLPLELRRPGGEYVRVQGILDSGSTVNVLPYHVGVRLGAVWESQTTRVQLTGNLAAQEARALIVEARVAELAPVRLVFAWTRAESAHCCSGKRTSLRNSTCAFTAPAFSSRSSRHAADIPCCEAPVPRIQKCA